MNKRSSLNTENRASPLAFPVRKTEKHKTTIASPQFNSFHHRRSEENISMTPLKKRTSRKKKSVSFFAQNSSNVEQNHISQTLESPLQTVGVKISPEVENPLNFNVNFIEKKEEENDIDAETLKKFKHRYPQQRFTLLHSGETDFYKISTIREESDEEIEESKRFTLRNSNERNEIPRKSLENSKNMMIPKYGSKFLIEELFGEKDDSLDSISSSESESSEEEIKINLRNMKKKKKKFDKPLIPNTNEKKKVVYNYLQDFLRPTLDQGHDDIHENIEENTQLKKEITAIPQLFRQHTKLITKRKPDFLKVVMMSNIERIHIDYDLFPDSYPLLIYRKLFWLIVRFLFSFFKK